MDRQKIERLLDRHPDLPAILGEFLGAWRQELIDDMIAEPKRKRREALWLEQSYLERLAESIEIELNSIPSGNGRESITD